MARLEYEITGNVSGLVSSVNQAIGSFGSLQDTYDRLSQKAQQAGADSLALQGEILALKKSLDDGTISQAQYNQQLDQLSGFLRDTNSALSGYQNQLASVSKATQQLNATPISPDTSQLAGVNAQLGSLQNNLFGSRRIAIDFTRAIAEAPVSVEGFARNIGLLAVDFLFYSQSAQFAAKATKAASLEIGAAQTVTATTGNGIKNLGAAFSSLLNPLNAVVLGIGILVAGYVLYEKSQEAAVKATNAFKKALAGDEYGQAIKAIEELKLNLESAREGFIDKGKVIDEYNNTIGKVTGSVDTLDAAERGLSAHANDFIRVTLLKAAATVVLQDAAKAAADTAVENQKIQDKIDKLEANKKIISANKDPNAFGGDARGVLIATNKDILSFTQDIKDNNQKLAEETSKRISLLTNFNNQQKDIFKKLGVPGGFVGTGANGISDIAKLNNSNADLEIQLEQEKDLLIINNKKASLTERLSALKDYYDKAKLITNNEARLELSQFGLSNAQIININDKKNLDLYKSDVAYEKKRQELLKTSKSSDPFIAIGNELDRIFNKTNALANESGLQGYALEVQKIKDKYVEINTTLDQQQVKLTKLQSKDLSPKLQKEADTDQAKLDRDRISSQIAEQKDLSDAKIKEATRVANEIQRINDEFGVKAEVSRGRELAQIQKRYDAEIVKAHGNADILDTLNKDRLIAIQAVDDKYIVQERQTYDRIIAIADQAFQILATGEENRTNKINIQSQKRIDTANVEFNKLRDLAKGLPKSSTDQINTIQAQVDLVIKAANVRQVSEEISKNFASAMQSAVDGFVSNFYTALTTLGVQRQTIDDKYNQQLASATTDLARQQIEQQRQIEQSATTSFGAIFSSLVDKFKSTFNTSILDSFTKQFTENLGKTLLAPTAKQLTISPEQQGAQEAAVLLKNAGDDLAAQIKQAGIDFASSIKTIQPGLLNGASGGSSPLLQASGLSAAQSIITPALSQISTSGLKFSSAIETAAVTAGGVAVGAAVKAGNTTVASSEQAGTKISQAAAGLATAASLAGGLISGLGKPTNKVTSALGGAVSGAGEGALIGSVVPVIGTVAGAIIGGTIGLISGLFSASKAKKQEELQQQQLAQQQLTNELLARQNALAYTASIIGRMTTQGIVTGADINAFGQLTATVSGKSILFVLDRVNNGR